MAKTEEKVEIKNITIQIGKVKATMAVDQAKKLQAALNELFGAPVATTTVVTSPIIIEREVPSFRPYSPFYWNNADNPVWKSKTVSGVTAEFSAGCHELLCKVED